VIGGLLAACAAPATATPQTIEVTKIVAGTPVTEQVVVTATPQATANPYDDKAPITVWIDQPRQPAIDAFIKANPADANLIKAVIVDREQFPSKVLLSITPTGLAGCGLCRAAARGPRSRCSPQFPA